MKATPRYLLLVIALAALMLLIWIVGLRPQQQALLAEQQGLNQQIRTLQQRQRQWYQHPDNAQLQRQLNKLQALIHAPGDAVRAVETVLAARRHQLEEWQPEGTSRTLTLHLPWQAFQSLFAELAQAAAPLPVHFQLLAQPRYLVAQLWLEADDAP